MLTRVRAYECDYLHAINLIVKKVSVSRSILYLSIYSCEKYGNEVYGVAFSDDFFPMIFYNVL